MQNIDNLIDLFLLVNIMDEKIRDEEVYLNQYTDYSYLYSREQIRNYYMNKSIEELISEIDILLINEQEGSDFLNTYYPIEDVINSFIEIKESKILGSLYSLLKNIGREGTEISPLSVFLLSEWEDDFKIKKHFNKYLPEKEINYDTLIKVNGNLLTGVEILNNLSLEPLDVIKLLKDGSYFHYNATFYKSQQIKSILNFANNHWKDKYSEDLKSLNKTVLLDNLGGIDLKEDMSNFLNNHLTPQEIKEYIQDKVFSIEKMYNVLDLLSTTDKKNEINQYIKKTLLDPNSYAISLMNIDTDKQKYREGMIIRDKVDNKYYDFFNAIKKCYGDSFLHVVIKNINEISNKELSNVIDVKKVAYEQLKNLPFYYLLKNLNGKTINFLLDEGYKLHPSEINIINKTKKYKNIVNEKNLININSIEIEKSLPVRIKKTLSNINKNNLEELKKILEEDREGCINYFNESRKELDNKIHYNYSDKELITERLISSTSPVMSMILSKELDVIYTLLSSEINLTEKEVSLLYFPFGNNKKTINNREDIDKEFLKFIKRYDKSLNDLFYNLLVENKLKELTSTKWNKIIPEIINVLFDKTYESFSEKDMLKILDKGFALSSQRELSIFIYDKLSEKDKNILYYFTRTESEENYLKTILKNACQKDINNREYLETFFNYFENVLIKNINEKREDPNIYISMLKSNEKEIAFSNIDLLDSVISKIEKNELTKSMTPISIKSKNRL